MIKQENISKYPKIFVFLGCRKNLLGTNKRVRISHGERVIGVLVIEVLLYQATCKQVNIVISFPGFPSWKHAYIILTPPPLKPHFYIVKLGFTGYTLFFLFLLKNIDCGYSLEPPRWGGSNEYLHSIFWAEIWKISNFFLSEYFQFLEVKISIYLNRRVFVMPPKFIICFREDICKHSVICTAPE